MVTISMMSGKLTTLGLLKIKIFQSKGYYNIIVDDDLQLIVENFII